MHGGNSVVDRFQVEIVIVVQKIVIPSKKKKWNLPMVHNSQFTSKENILYGPKLRSALAYLGLWQIDFFGDIYSTNILCRAANWDRR